MKKGDLIIFGVVAIIAAILFVSNYVRNQNDQPIKVEVRVNGDLEETFSIEEEIVKVYETEYGLNELTIHEGIVSVSDADCRDQICVDTKHGTSNGDAIVCVPNRFTVELIGEGGEIDAIAR